MKKRAVVLSVVLVGVSTMYLGYRIHRARHCLEQYKAAFGYDTPTRGLSDCVFESPAWKGMLVDASIAYTDGAHNIEPYDIDGDGELELVANSYRADTLMMYQCGPGDCLQGQDRWVREVIDSRVGGGFPTVPMGGYAKAVLKQKVLGTWTEGAHYTAIGDLSGDGRADLVVAGDLTRYDVVWYEAVGSQHKRPSWKKHVAYRDDSHRTYHVEIGDIDGDADNDIVFATKTDNSLGWLENRRRDGFWPAVIIDANCTRCFYARVADVDRDGRAEILASSDDWQGGRARMCLYKHSGAPGTPGDWTRFDIARSAPGRGVSVFLIEDVDVDGDLDIVAGGHQGDVYVMRNPYPKQVCGPWETWCVREGSAVPDRDLREIDVGDVNLDGHPDIVVADEKQDAIIWFENPGETFSCGWQEHVVDQSHVYLRWCHSVKLGDIDGDGDLDIAVAAAGSNVFLLYLNQQRSPKSNVLPVTMPGQGSPCLPKQEGST